MKKLKMKIISDYVGFCLFAFAFLLHSCSARKVAIEREKYETTEQIAISEQQTAISAVQETINEAKIEISEMLHFSIEPMGNIPADFHFFIDGKEVKGSTSGKLEVNKENKKAKGESKKSQVSNEKTKATKQKQTANSEVRIAKTKNTERESLNYWWLLLIIPFFILGFLAWKFGVFRKLFNIKKLWEH